MEDDPLSGLPHGLSFRFVDRIVEHVPGVKVVALKNVTCGEPYMERQLPDLRGMPLAFLVEAMTQAAGVLVSKGEPTFLALLRDVRLRRPVMPGDRLTLEANLLQQFGSLHRCDVKAVVGGEVACQAEIVLSVGGDPP
ncbi:MAG TPA: 3-hydroxyacyl-ACP dehydratase FabZ family protein [Candidatus Deferrimicrobiaceae bacterium]